MKFKQTAIALMAAVVAIGTIALAEEKPVVAEKAEIKKQTTCPVMGGKIDKKQYVEVKGYRIYLCCPGCKEKITAEPEKYIDKLQAEGITLEKVQTTCPVMGGKIDKAQFVDVNGYRIYVCCAGCQEKIKADPEKYIKQLKVEGVAPEKTPKMKESAEEQNHSGHQH